MESINNKLKTATSMLLGAAFAYLMSYVIVGHFIMDPISLCIGAVLGLACRLHYCMVMDFTSRR